MKPVSDPSPREPGAWLTLHVVGGTVAFPAEAVRQILPNAGVIPVPLTRDGVIGVVVQDGRAIPVYRTESLLGGGMGPRGDGGAAAHIVVVEREGALAGLLVERAEPLRGRPAREPEIVDGIGLLARAGLFEDPGGDCDAAGAAGGALQE